ncbi:ribose-phosphate pyrophosphokinase [uncultured Desulfovibrio sp.]|uniref:ribose-phosphate diphosphokinase n=1 Tax=uncultured Desulfovibrio sp. TaxID=167968 RepID=UPI00262BD2BB|nr:ribose-phosphate pyrophosphokinase [uncultured Desulfovibrio sp.]
MFSDLKIVTGSSNPDLAKAICNHLGCQLTPTLATTFSDGELRIEIGDNVRGDDVFVVQPTCPPSVNRNFMQLCLMLDALKRASAGRITAVIPYYAYARQDRKVSPRAPISAKMVADFISTAGAERVVTIDLHAGQIQGFFDCPVDNLFATPVMMDPLRKYSENDDIVIVSPDAGGVERARSYAKRLNAPLAIVDKRRDKPNQAQAMHVIGEVEGKVAIVVDDMIDTAGTLCAGAEVLLKYGASRIIACATHPVLSGPAIERINNTAALDRVIVTDTIPLGDKLAACPKLEVVSVAALLGKTIHNIHTGSSVSVLFV